MKARGLKARDQRHALGGGGDFRSRPGVERRHQLPLGDVDQVASVDDLAAQVVEMLPGVGRLRPPGVKRREFADLLSRGVAVVGLVRPRQGDMQRGDAPLPEDGADFAPRQDKSRQQRQAGEADADQAERFRAGEQRFDQPVEPQANGETGQAAERRGQQAAP